MRILQDILNEILSEQNTRPPETGGILGGKEDIVQCSFFDKGLLGERICSYAPDTQLLNKVIKNWQLEEIDFMGIYHTHFWNVSTLSDSDRNYIKVIMKNMPSCVKTLYFPVVIMPEKKMAAYKAYARGEELVIEPEHIEII